MTEAMRRARAQVKEQMKRHRIRLADTDAKEIPSWARLYVEDHIEELVDQVRPVIEEWIRQGRFGKKAQRELLASR